MEMSLTREDRTFLLEWLDAYIVERAGSTWRPEIRVHETWQTGRLSGFYAALKEVHEWMIELSLEEPGLYYNELRVLEDVWDSIFDKMPTDLKRSLTTELAYEKYGKEKDEK